MLKKQISHTIAVLMLVGVVGPVASSPSYEEVVAALRRSIGFEPYSCPENKTCYCAKIKMNEKKPLAPLRYTKARYCPVEINSMTGTSLKFTSWDGRANKVDEGLYLNAKMHGLWTSWHPNGAKAAESKYVDGKQDGPFTTWHDNGRVAVQGRYKNGQSHAEWSYWDSSGKLTTQLVWDDGNLLSKREFK